MPKVLSASWISSGLLSEKAIDEETPHRSGSALNRMNATVHRTVALKSSNPLLVSIRLIDFRLHPVGMYL